MSSNPPFQKGDILCLEGSGVYHGCHVFRAKHDASFDGRRWFYGNRHWGQDPKHDKNLRHATLADVERLLAIESKALERYCVTFRVLLECREKLADRSAGNGLRDRVDGAS